MMMTVSFCRERNERNEQKNICLGTKLIFGLIICVFFSGFAVSEGDHEKVSKKELLLLGLRKDKKDKKDRGYATLDGESSPEEDFETK